MSLPSTKVLSPIIRTPLDTTCFSWRLSNPPWDAPRQLRGHPTRWRIAWHLRTRWSMTTVAQVHDLFSKLKRRFIPNVWCVSKKQPGEWKHIAKLNISVLIHSWAMLGGNVPGPVARFKSRTNKPTWMGLVRFNEESHMWRWIMTWRGVCIFMLSVLAHIRMCQ